jgi:uncharacterized UBP type Zn finger protein
MEKEKTIPKGACPHSPSMKVTHSRKRTCEACSEKVHLRICTQCGKVHCCESFNAHDTAHFKKTGHPIIKPVHTDYDFTWCYICRAYLE